MYCYELYHRWRSHWSGQFPFSLSGEVDKAGQPQIRNKPKPDFLVHVPGQNMNLLIMELKPANADITRMSEDLTKLTYFRRSLKDRDGNSSNYDAAYFWIYGLCVSEWPDQRNKLLTALQGNPDFVRECISCFIHEKAANRAVPVSWT